MKKILCMILLLTAFASFGQDKIQIEESDYNNKQVEMADTMRSEGKIYVVVGIVVVILVVMLGYIIHVDRKLSRLENQLANTDESHVDKSDL